MDEVKDEINIDTRVTGERTVIDVTGTRDVAVVVRSASGERIYLPPESFDEPVSDSPYSSPYQGGSGIDGEESPYGGGSGSTRGVTETADGFRITHPETATEFDVYRGDE
ncbi:hypothetical protein FK85_08170 [Halorubrum saccharovorum]|uniref:Uncharacterized protein n=1 Tax=Halorubrum saccharovorum TaxID=2248 RepID=A0A081EU46_9EURY|nr:MULTISPECIES: hypothetical protein [Halorubrum]KDS90934.1 hypothetical protein FK85_08170 [Halorubrum saccharovorum]